MATFEDYSEYTAKDWMRGILGIEVPEEIIDRILAERDFQPDAYFQQLEDKEKDLIKADLYFWASTSASKTGVTKDSDATWSHSEGGAELSDATRKQYLKMANVLYQKWGEESISISSGSRIRINNQGMRLWGGPRR